MAISDQIAELRAKLASLPITAQTYRYLTSLRRKIIRLVNERDAQ